MRIDVGIEVARVASTPATIEERAHALLEPLRRVVPFRAAWISLLDPERHEQPPLVSEGYEDNLRRYMGGREGVAEIEQLGLNRSRGATLLSALPVPLDEVPSWAEYLAPAGFRGGVTVGLFAPDGRYFGIVGLNTDTDAHPTRAASDCIGRLAPMIAHALDPMRSLSAAAKVIRDARAGTVATRSGNGLALPGLPTHPLLRSGSIVLAVAAEHLAGGGRYASFLCRYRGEPSWWDLVRLTVLDCAGQPPEHMVAVVTVSPPGNLRGLTWRELEMLGLLVEDWPDERIAVALGVGKSAVAARIDRIRIKLEAPTRDVATLRGQRLGLYIPPRLTSANRCSP
jgi:DNA-binding CsgD family transcriptional regulator